MEVALSFDIGTYSTKISFDGKRDGKGLVTVEIVNLILFTKSNKVVIGEKAIRKLNESYEQNANSFVAGFTHLLNKDKKQYQQSDDSLFTFANVKTTETSPILFKINNINALISPEKCLVYFIKKAKEGIRKEYFSEKDVKFTAKIAFNAGLSFIEMNKLKKVFDEAGFVDIGFFHKSSSLALLYAKQHSFQLNKHILFVDIGYSSTSLYIVHVSGRSVKLLFEQQINMGMRDLDFEIYLQILADLKEKYGIDYQKDKNIRFSILNKLNQLKKTFSINSEITLNLANTFGSRYFDQYVSISSEIYIKRNERNLKFFNDKLVSFCNDFIKKNDITLTDIGLIGGGQKLSVFGELIDNATETSFDHNKISYNYSISKGILFKPEYEGEISYVNTEDILYEILELNSDQEKIKKEDKQEVATENGKEKSEKEENDKDPIWQKNEENQSQSHRELIDAEEASNPYSNLKVAKGDVLFEKDEVLNINDNKKLIEFDSEENKQYLLNVFTFNRDKGNEMYSLFRQEIKAKFTGININLIEGLQFRDLSIEPSKELLELPSPSKEQANEKSMISLQSSCTKSEHETGPNEIIINVQEQSVHSHSHHSHGHKKNPLINATFLHVMADFLQGIFLLILAIAIYFKPALEILDPIISIIISVLIIYLAGKYTIRLFIRLMDATPSDIDFQAILGQLAEISGVREIHDLHIWDLGDHRFAGTAHLVSSEKHDEILKKATLVFRKQKIYHTTIQIENPLSQGDSMYINCDNNID